MKKISLLLMVISLVGCNTDKATIKELKSQKVNYQMSYDATRRGSIISIDSSGRITKMLSEVQPDAAITQTTDFTNNLSAKLKIGDEFTSEQIVKMTENLSSLGQVTVAVNILRDALYRLEEHCLNFPKNCEENYWGRYDTVVKQIVALQIQVTNQAKEKTDQAVQETQKLKAEIELKSLDPDFDARTNYQTAIQLLLNKDEKNSLNYFRALFEKYPLHFNIDEINEELIKLSKEGMNDKKWKELYQFIVKDKLWRIDENLQKQLIEKTK